MKTGIKLAAVLLAALFALCGCTMPWQSDEPKTVVTVSGASVGADLYACYLAQILHDPASYDLQKKHNRADAEQKAVQLCAEHVAVNTMFVRDGLHLTPEYKTRIAENVSVKWDLYRNFYNAVGVRKQTLTEYETAAAKRELLIANKYGEHGTAAVSKIELDAYYAVNYVTFRSVNGYLTRIGADGKTERLSQDEITQVENDFRRMCEEVRGGTSLEDVVKENAGSGSILSSEVQTVTINRTTSNYPSEFFATVQQQMEEGTPRVIETEDNIFLVVKESSEKDENLSAHRFACLLEKSGPSFQNDLNAELAGYKVQKSTTALGEIWSVVRKQF